MTSKIAITSDGRSHRTALLAGLLAAVILLGWLQWRALASARDTYDTALTQLGRMQVDARQIQALRQAPKAAVSRTRPNEELLAQVEASLAAAGIDRDRWHDSVPQPPVRVPKSDYRRHTTRLSLEAITLRQLAAFACDLQANDPTLEISGVDLVNRHQGGGDFEVDLAVSYLVYAPRRAGAARPD